MPSWSTACFGSFKKDGDGFYNKSNIDIDNEESLNEERRSISIVELEKREGATLGLIISGGIDKNSIPKIANLRPGSIAHRSDALSVGDHIISVNGIHTSKLKHEEIINLLKNAGNKVVLEIEYEIPLTTYDDCLSKVIQVKLDKENESFGFTLRGGSGRPLTITNVRFGGPANRVGIIKAGDRLLAVDGISLSMASLQEVLQILKQIKQTALLTIEYDVSIIQAVKNATGPLLVEIDKTPGCLLGISLSCISVPAHAIVIESIRQASVAERCGALHVGDHILAIDNIKVDLMTSAEAMQLLKSSCDVVKLEILPLTLPEHKRGFCHFAPRSSLSGLSTIPVGCTSALRKPCNGSLSKSVIGRADRTELILSADHKGFGFMLQGPSFASVPPIISFIDFGGPAERCGVLQVGDRILAVNGESTEGLCLEEVTSLITLSHSRLSLIIEFDVAEAVVPSSGTFTVKLVKRVSDVGITLTAPRNRQLGEALLIADVRKGSVAHRTGSIQPGDKLLAINSLRTENCSVEDAAGFLHSCNDIVKLRIRKDESFSEDPDTVVYTVELIRHGGPLGITVSGTEEPFDPIYISSLTENGLAERTGALHVGDRILAINGNSLRGKTLNEAICILQTSGDKVTLKISKCPCPQRSDCGDSSLECFQCVPEKQFSPSIDSAVDSWDSCNPTASNCRNQFDGHSASDGNISASYQSKRDSWELKTVRSNSFSGSPSDEEKENWHKVLEDLQTCGQSQLLRQIEQSILGAEDNRNEIQQLSMNVNKQNYSMRHSLCNEASSIYSAPLPIEIHRVTLFKDQVYEDFGFSLSDGKYENGVFINSIRSGGPADLSGLIKPLDKILQVNNVRSYNAGLIVPLIASSGDRIELVLSRPAYNSESSSESTLGRTSHWEEGTFPSNSQTQTL